jgi:transposase
MTATHSVNSTRPPAPVLYLSFELSSNQWKIASTTARGQQARLVSIPARDTGRVLREIGRAKVRFGLPRDAAVFSCYEAGRDGFWLDRFLHKFGVNNLVVDSSSIEVNRRLRRAKADSLDAVSLVGLLVRYCEGETKVWSTVTVPSPFDEDQRHGHRELNRLRRERTTHTNRIRGLLAAVGIKVPGKCLLAGDLDTFLQWNGEPLGENLKRRLVREFERLELLTDQIEAIEAEQAARIRDDQTRHVAKVRRLMGLKGVGPTSATILVYEFFGWRRFANRREVAALAGLTPTPYQSGDSNHEQGISKAGNVLVRWIMVELAWSWLRFQPHSPLSRWYDRRFGSGTSRMKRTGIVALARKLLIELWRYVEHGEALEGADEMDWEPKLRRAVGRRPAQPGKGPESPGPSPGPPPPSLISVFPVGTR